MKNFESTDRCTEEYLEKMNICRPSGSWIECKHSIIREYWPAFLAATQGASHRAYVDLFAGPGCNFVRETGQKLPGSPLIALQATTRKAPTLKLKYPQYPIAQFYFNDLDKNNVEQLKLIADRCFPQLNVYYSIRDANTHARSILKTINENTPTFFVLDPEGSELYWSTIETIAQKHRAEVLINLAIGGLKRLMGKDDAASHDRVTRVFGTDEWITIARRYDGGRISDRELLNLYQKRLEKLGFHVATSESGFSLERIVTNTKNVPLYYLIFAAKGPKAPLALKIAQGILKKDCFGARLLF